MVARHFIRGGSGGADVRTARLVCRDWQRLVTRYGDPLVWCQRLWSNRPKDAHPLGWPRDGRFPLSLSPGFLDMVLHCETVRFTWHHLLPLARRVIEKRKPNVEEQRAWDEICERYPEAASVEVVHQLLLYETHRPVSSHGLSVVLQSAPFRDAMLQHLKWYWYLGCEDAIHLALSLLRMGVWCSRFDEPMLEREGEELNEPTVVELAWNRFLELEYIREPQVLEAVCKVRDPDLVDRLERHYPSLEFLQ